MRALLSVVLTLVLLAACGDDGPACASDADCATGHACVGSGGVLFGSRICVDVRAPVEDVGTTADVDADAGHCIPVSSTCLDHCGEVEAPDGCGETVTIDCGECDAPMTCGAIDPGKCGCDPETYCETSGQQCGPAPEDACPGQQIDCGGCHTGVCDSSADVAVCDCGEGYEWSNDGRRCRDVDECSESDACPADGSICRNEAGSFRCECDEEAGFFGDDQEDCRRPPEIIGQASESGFGVVSVPVTSVPDSIHVVSVASHGPVTDVEGLGSAWLPIGEEQCSESSRSYVALFAGLDGGAGDAIQVTTQSEGGVVVHVTTIAGVALMTAPDLVQGNSTADGSCDDGSGGVEDVAVSTGARSSTILVVVGGLFPADAITWPAEVRAVGTEEFAVQGGMSITVVVIDAPVEVPAQQVTFQVADDDYAYFAGAIPAESLAGP